MTEQAAKPSAGEAGTTSRHLDDVTVERWIDGLAPEADAHVEACDACRARAERASALVADLARVEDPLPPLDFTRGVLARIEARERETAWERGLGLGILVASLAIAAASFAAAGEAALEPVAAWVRTLIDTSALLTAAGALAGAMFDAFRAQIAIAAALGALALVTVMRKLVPVREVSR